MSTVADAARPVVRPRPPSVTACAVSPSASAAPIIGSAPARPKPMSSRPGRCASSIRTPRRVTWSPPPRASPPIARARITNGPAGRASTSARCWPSACCRRPSPSPPRSRGCTPRMPAWRSPKRKRCPTRPAGTWRRSLRPPPPRRCRRVGSPAVITPRSPPASGRPSAPTSPASAAAATRSAMGAGSTSTRTRPAIPTCAMAAPGMVLHEHVTTKSC